MKQFYPIFVVPLTVEDGGGYMGYAPDLRGCMSHGDTPEEAFKNAQEAAQEWIEEAEAEGMDIPEPGSASTQAKKEREKLLSKIQEQNAAMKVIEGKIEVLRSSLASVTERLGDMPMWVGFIPPHAMHAESEDAVH